MKWKKFGLWLVIVALIFGLGVGAGWLINRSGGQVAGKQTEVKDKYSAFIDEVYGIIKENYWNKMEENDLNQVFVLGVEKLTGQPMPMKGKTKADLIKALAKVMEQYGDDQEKKKMLVTTLTDTVLSNLEPFGRSRLYAQKDEKALSDTVSNKTETDHYQELKVDKDASAKEIALAYEKEAALVRDKAKTDPKAKEKLEKVEQAYKVLKDSQAKTIYDAAGIEPTIDYRLINPSVAYMHLTKFSPTTLDELVKVSQELDKGQASALIVDLRDNIGGAIDGLPYFAGPFIGNDQYAYQFFHQGEKEDFKTKMGWLPGLFRYKKVVVLINENSQSTAEVLASVMKKYNVGVVMGTKTKGWGTVERVFPVKNQIDDKEKYSLFLVHSLTLKEDGQPIEGKGVEPVIDIKNGNWETELLGFFNFQPLVSAVKEVYSEK